MACLAGLQDEDEFLVMGCDGLWDVMTSQDAIDFVRHALRQGDTPDQVGAMPVGPALFATQPPELLEVLRSPLSARPTLFGAGSTVLLTAGGQSAGARSDRGASVHRQRDRDSRDSCLGGRSQRGGTGCGGGESDTCRACQSRQCRTRWTVTAHTSFGSTRWAADSGRTRS